jgi:hypothetical protein
MAIKNPLLLYDPTRAMQLSRFYRRQLLPSLLKLEPKQVLCTKFHAIQ